MILNPGTSHFDSEVSAKTAIITNALAPTPYGSPSDLNNNPASDNTSL